MPDQAVILIAEDREDDILLIQRSLLGAGISNHIQIVRNGDQTIAYLKGEGKFANREEFPLPALLLLDLKMPRTDGFQVLSWIRQQPSLKALRIIVLTASSDMRDVNEAYELGANSFLVKPVDFQNFVEISRFLKDYWLRLDKAPAISRPPKTKEAPTESLPGGDAD
jgi:CheY-like chemotaxis protein